MRNYQDADDFTLLRGCVFNHREARTEFLAAITDLFIPSLRHRPPLPKVDPTIIEDLVQDVFVALLGAIAAVCECSKGKWMSIASRSESSR